MWKNYIQNIGLKQHITAVHEERDSIVINVAKVLLEDAIWKCSWKKLWIQLWSLWQKFHQSFHESDKTLNWKYKLQLFIKMKRFNFDQCGKIFAKGCNLNDHEIDSQKKDTYKFFMKVFWFSLNKMWILWWYIMYLGYNLSFKKISIKQITTCSQND